MSNPFQWSNAIIQFVEKETNTSFQKLILTKLAGDASTRSYFRLQHQHKTWILLQTDPFLDEHSFPYINVQRHLISHGIYAPQIYALHPKEGILLIEDFGDNLLEKVVHNLTPKQYAKYYFLAIDELFKIHFDASQKTTPCVSFTLYFDTEKLLWELNHTKKYLFEKYLNSTFSKEEEETINQTFLKLCRYLDAEPRYFTHRDYHSRNLIIYKEKIGVLDFQDARMGPCQYDLASLLKDSYVALPQELVQELLKYYLFEKKAREGKEVDEKHFQKTFDWMAIQRNLKAMGTFAYLHIEKGKSNYLQYLKPTWNYVRENLEKFEEFKEFYKILSGCCKNL